MIKPRWAGQRTTEWGEKEKEKHFIEKHLLFSSFQLEPSRLPIPTMELAVRANSHPATRDFLG